MKTLALLLTLSACTYYEGLPPDGGDLTDSDAGLAYCPKAGDAGPCAGLFEECHSSDYCADGGTCEQTYFDTDAGAVTAPAVCVETR